MTAIEAQSDREYLALLETVLANPADDAPRLIISDWLEEHGFDERAELIRLQIAGDQDGTGVVSYTYWMRREWGLFPTPVRRLKLEHFDDLKMSPGDGRIAPVPGGIRMSAGMVATMKLDKEVGDAIRAGDVISVGVTKYDRMIGEVTKLIQGRGRHYEVTVLLDSLTNMDSGWTRGFISSVSLTCEAFVGGQCETCKGLGWPDFASYNARNFRRDFAPPCYKCRGTGRIEGVARELFSRHPITEVRLVDKNPSPLPLGEQMGFYGLNDRDYQNTTQLHENDSIPSSVATHMTGFKNKLEGVDSWRWYDTETEANAALSRACVAYGRSKAGLDPLQPR
jgi:uncharacterized protein (TIGR02996 family)